jgi:hypothetical protein
MNPRAVIILTASQKHIKNLISLAALLLMTLHGNTARSAVINWTNINGGSWSVTNNWSPNQVPGPADIASINVSNTVTLDGSYAIAGLDLASGTLASASPGDSLTVNGLFHWSGGAMATTGGVTLNGASSLNSAVANGLNLTGLLINAGQMTWSGSGQNLWLNLGTITNLTNGTITIANDVSADGGGTLVNAGLLIKTGTAGTSTFTAAVVNTGTLQVQLGTLSLSGGGTESGLITAANGATLNFGGGTHSVASNFSATGPGTLGLSGGVLNLNNPTVLTISNMAMVGGDLGGNGLLTVNGQFTWSGGTIANTAGVKLNGASSLNSMFANGMNLQSSLINAGALNWSGIGTNLFFNGGTITNLSNGTITITTDVSSSSGGTIFVNAGLMTKTGGSGITTLSATIVNTGTLAVQSGTINLAGSYTLNNGTLDFGIGGTTNFGKISLSGIPSFKANLGVNLIGYYWPPVGTSFNLINYGTKPAALLFTNTALPPFISWQTNYNSNAFTLTATARQTNTAPTNLTMSLAGNSNLNLAWPGDHTGWQLEAQTNPLQVGISTNWVIVSGSDQTNQVTVPVGLSNGAVFFRLAYP